MHPIPLNLPGSNILNVNSAGYSGGGIYAPESKLDFSGTCMLSGNMAQLDGGGIYAVGSNMNLLKCLTKVTSQTIDRT